MPRIDKWLWAARFFKTRSLAAQACELGRIEANGLTAKPSREVRIGDMLKIRNDGGVFVAEVLIAGQLRGPAAMAQTFYRETAESREARLRAAEERKMARVDFWAEGKPSKRDRRAIDRFRRKW